MTKEEYIKNACDTCMAKWFPNKNCWFKKNGGCPTIRIQEESWDAAQKATTEKVCEWLHENAGYSTIGNDERWEFNLADLKKAMEESK